MNICIIIGLLITHFVFDFMLQTNEQAINKYRDKEKLTEHVMIYGCGLFIFITVFGLLNSWNFNPCFFWVVLNTVLHWITDYYTSRLSHVLGAIAKEKNNYHDFFVGIGFDQTIHFVTLFLTFHVIVHSFN